MGDAAGSAQVIVVRIYLTEGQARLAQLIAYLHDECKVRGVTVFRGICGFGRSGHIHSASLLDLSLDLPLVIEFFDDPERVRPILERLRGEIAAGHMLHWDAWVST